MTIYEKQGGTYRKVGDYRLPNLKLNTEQNAQIGVWGNEAQAILETTSQSDLLQSFDGRHT